MIGCIVCSKAGRDKGSFMVVVSVEDGCPLVCDGKERPIERPKKKDIKHLSVTNSVLKEEQYRSNRALRRALNEYRGIYESFKEEQ